MGTILLIVLGVAMAFGIGAFILSREGDPKDRAREAAAAATTGAVFAG